MRIVSANPIAQRGLFGDKNVVEAVFFEKDQILFAEIVGNLRASLKHPLRPRTQDALHSGKHASNVKVVKEDIFGPELCDDAANAPNIDFIIIPCSKDHLRGSVASRLYIGSQIIVDKAGVAKVDYFHFDW